MVYFKSIVRNRPTSRPKMTAMRRALFEKHDGICAYCRRKTEMPSMLPGTFHELTATVEHIVPVSRGGKWRGDNVTLACAYCNTTKADMTPQQWTEFMMLNPRWWERAKKTSAGLRRFVRRAALPIDHSKYILQNGKKAYREWAAAGFPELRPLRSDEPIPVRYDCPVAQAAYEAAYQNRKHLLRIPAALGQ